MLISISIAMATSGATIAICYMCAAQSQVFRMIYFICLLKRNANCYYYCYGYSPTNKTWQWRQSDNKLKID